MAKYTDQRLWYIRTRCDLPARLENFKLEIIENLLDRFEANKNKAKRYYDWPTRVLLELKRGQEVRVQVRPDKIYSNCKSIFCR